MRGRTLGAAAALAAIVAVGWMGLAARPGRASARLRIGVYDNRAIAIACVRTNASAIFGTRRAEYAAAKRAGDSAKAQEMEKWLKNQQRLLHFQGFGHVPVGDLLEPIKPQLAQLARANGLSAIAMECDVAAPGVEIVDVTDAIVDLYRPDAQTRKVTAGIRNQRALSLTELADLPAEE